MVGKLDRTTGNVPSSWLRFSLATFLTVITLLCLLLGSQVSRIRERREAALQIEEAGGRLIYRHQYPMPRVPGSPAKPRYYPDSRGQAWLRKQLGDDWANRAESVRLIDIEQSGDLLTRIGCLNELKGLTLEGSDVGDGDLKYLTDLQHLQGLVLSHTDLSSRGLRSIVALKELRRLSLRATLLTDEGLMYVSELQDLVDLDLGYTDVTDSGLELLRRCRKLRRLNVEYTRTTDAGVSRLSRSLPSCSIKR